MPDQASEHVFSKYRYEFLFGAWLLVTGGTFLRISKQPYSSRLKTEQYESIFKGTSLGAVLLEHDCARHSTRKTITSSSNIHQRKNHHQIRAILGFLSTQRPGDDVERVFVDIVSGVAPSFLASPQSFTCSELTPNPMPQILSTTTRNMLVGRGYSGVELNMWNPVYALAPFVLVVVSVPLAVCAVITTSFAVTLLACRAAVVYVQLTIALVGAWFDPRPSTTSIESLYPPLTPSSEGKSPTRPRHRYGNISSTSSQETIVAPARAGPAASNNLPFKMSVMTNEVARDFEGVGGWRTPGDDDEEALWMNMNSRLELPREAPSRRHQRSVTGGTSPSNHRSWSPESLRMSPAQSRARTPVRFALDDDDYFPPESRTSTRCGGNASESSKKHKRRKNENSSSSTSPV